MFTLTKGTMGTPNARLMATNLVYFEDFMGREQVANAYRSCIPAEAIDLDSLQLSDEARRVFDDFGCLTLSEDYARPLEGFLGDIAQGDLAFLRMEDGGTIMWDLVEITRHQSIDTDQVTVVQEMVSGKIREISPATPSIYLGSLRKKDQKLAQLHGTLNISEGAWTAKNSGPIGETGPGSDELIRDEMADGTVGWTLVRVKA